ncbi:MAG: hypothetical protein AAF416_19880 [Pseudomonadota bacterium]
MATANDAQGDHAAQRDELIENLPLDAVECAVLDIARRFFATFARPDSQAWMGAMDAAERAFGADGGMIAHRIVKTIQMLRSSRTADFAFMNPDCACCRHKITPSERYFVMILHAQRRGRQSESILNAIFVCGGGDPYGLVDAIAVLARDVSLAETV